MLSIKIIKFEQSACQPCKSVSNYLDAKNVQYDSINVFDYPEEASKFLIMTVPVTILLNDDGKEISRSIGYRPNELDAIINQL